jgi:hypothetical protein
MKVEIEVDVPDGWELTGEFHRAFKGNGYLSTCGALIWTSDMPSSERYIILRKVEPVRESRWRRIPDKDSLAGCCLWSEKSMAIRFTGESVERIDYENGKPVSVTLEPVEEQ